MLSVFDLLGRRFRYAFVSRPALIRGLRPRARLRPRRPRLRSEGRIGGLRRRARLRREGFAFAQRAGCAGSPPRKRPAGVASPQRSCLPRERPSTQVALRASGVRPRARLRREGFAFAQRAGCAGSPLRRERPAGVASPQRSCPPRKRPRACAQNHGPVLSYPVPMMNRAALSAGSAATETGGRSGRTQSPEATSERSRHRDRRGTAG
jgi:hypothetical protein